MRTTTFPFGKPFQTQFTPDPGKFDQVTCSVCGAIATVERNRFGPTGWAEAMGKGGHKYDRFRCPVNDAEPDCGPFSSPSEGSLHGRIQKLSKEIEETASVNLKTLFLKEIDELKSRFFTVGAIPDTGDPPI